jgi:branched-chain amino acid transport system permease protein
MKKESYKWIAVFFIGLVCTVLFKSYLYVLIYASFFAIFAMSWSFFTSFSGYLNIGHVIFIGIAGYTTGIFNYYFHFPLILSIPIGAAAGSGIGWLFLNWLHRKISGLSFEMVTFLSILALSDLVLTSYLRPVTGADLGISPLDSLLSSLPLAIGLIAFMCISGYLFIRFLNSRQGKVLDFARGNRELVKTAGLDPHKYSGLCLLYSGIVGAIGGALYVHFSGAAGVSNTFALEFQVNIIVMAILGGRFSMYGSIVGAFIVIILEEFLMGRVPGSVQNLIIYCIALWVYFSSPGGLFGIVTTMKKRLRG